MAGRLLPGEPCPVCGSVEHPAPASSEEGAPSQDDVKAAEARAKEKRIECERASELLSEEKRGLTGKAGELNGLLENTPLRGESPLSVRQRIGGECRQAALKTRESRLSLAQAVQDAKRFHDLEQSVIPGLLARQESIRQERSRLDLRGTELRTSSEEKKLRIDEDAASLPFPQKREAEMQRDALRRRLAVLRGALEDARKKKEGCERDCGMARGEISTRKERLGAAAPADIPMLKSVAEQLRLEIAASKAEEERLAERRGVNEEIMERLRPLSASLKGYEARYGWLSDLRDVFCGRQSGKDKLELETYVLAKWFALIVERANTKLLRMSSGQYELCLEGQEGEQDARRKTGLDLGVKDHYNGTVRSVRTLSGGESFKAALSLALGLADVVQERSGGIRLDTLFIDEGFGSLDDQSLDQAMGVLERMGEGRLIGIISHVGELKRRIERQVIVSREKTGGSSVRIEL